jgi:2-polyprenyl-3-methyl-5-hydroxy-6-metoxy-1,4-benzoquinol methylase
LGLGNEAAMKWTDEGLQVRPQRAGSLQGEQAPRQFSRPKEYADLYRGCGPVAQFFNRRLAHVFDRLTPIEGGRLLDVGCGPGILLSQLVDGRFELFGADSSPEMIREATVATARQAAQLVVAQIEHLPYPNNFFDVILALGILEYLPDLEVALAEIARVAKPDAIIVVSMLNRESMYWWWQLHLYRRWIVLRSFLSSRRWEPFVMPILHTKQRLMRAMNGCQIKPLDVTYFDVNVCVEPVASRYPELSSRINRRLEGCVSKKFSRFMHSGFVILATFTPIL